MEIRRNILKILGQEQGSSFGLRMKLLVLIATVIVVVSSLITYFYQSRIRTSFFSVQTRSLESQLEFVGKVGKSLFADISQGRSSIERFFEDLEKHNPDVRFFVVRSSRGETLYERIPNPVYRSFSSRFTPPEEPKTVYGETEIAGEKIVYVAVPVEISMEFAPGSLDLFLEGGGLLGGGEAQKGKSTYLWILGGASAQRIVEEFYQLRYQLLKYTIPITLLILLFFYFLLGRMVAPLLAMVQAAQGISQGRFGERVEIVSEDEVGVLAHSFNLMVERLSSLFEQIRLSSQNLSRVVEDLGQAAEDIHQGAGDQFAAFTDTMNSLDEMDRSIAELAQSISELKNSVVDSRSSITEMTSTIQEIENQMKTLNEMVDTHTGGIRIISTHFDEIKERIAILQRASHDTASATNQVDKNIEIIKNRNKEVSTLMENVVQLTESGEKFSQRTLEGIEEIARRFARIHSAALSLSEKGERIRKIIETVREIADQTNLLALNASITAAQAGAEGQQFNEIAREIKALSERSQSSIKEIRQHVETVSSESKSLVEEVSRGAQAVDQGRSLASDAEKLLKEIHSLSFQVLEQISSISRATDEQSSGSHLVNQSMQNIFHMVEEIQKSISAQEEQIRAIRAAAERMLNIATIVRNSTSENTKGSQRLSVTIEKMSRMYEAIERGIEEQKGASQRIIESAQRIRNLSKKNQELVHRLGRIVRVLREELEKFQNLTTALQGEEKLWQ